MGITSIKLFLRVIVITGTEDTFSMGYRLQTKPMNGMLTKFLLNKSAILHGYLGFSPTPHS